MRRLSQTALHKSREDLFPTIRMMPKQLSEVERCYWSAAKLAKLPGSASPTEEKQFQ